MNDTENAWNRLARLIQEEPPREGRTGSVRNEKRRAWISRVRDWLDRGLKAEKDGQGVKVALYGETLPGTDVRRREDGTIKAEYRGKITEELPEDWSPKLPLLPPAADTERFRRKCDREYDRGRYWSLFHPIKSVIRQQGIETGWLECSVPRKETWSGTPHTGNVEREWIEAASALADYKTFLRLEKIAGQKLEYNVRNHNLAKLSLPALKALAKSNPGALGWWLRQREKRDDLEERRIHFNRLKHDPLYQENQAPPLEKDRVHPGEAVSRVKAEFAQAGGRRWKGLLRQPAWHVARQLEQHGRKRAAWMADLLSEARQQGMKAEPPIEIKQMLMYHNWSIGGDSHARRPALLLLKAAARKHGKRIDPWQAAELITQFNDAADYAAHEPAAAARANSWNGLVKASRRWHNVNALRLMKEELEKALARQGVNPDERWETPLAEAALSGGFQARLLGTPRELMQEALSMAHCAGTPDYILRCRQGQARIFRLERPETGKPEEATTLELAAAEAGEWRIRQHQGYRNRPPAAEESRAAGELLATWRKACNAQTEDCARGTIAAAGQLAHKLI